MEFSELLEKRRSCRCYSGKKVETEVLKKIVEKAKLAPSACNSQPWFLTVVNDEEKIKEIASATHVFGSNAFSDNAGAFIVIEQREPKLKESVTKLVGSRYFADNDIGIVTGYLTLSAYDCGVESCVLGLFDKDVVKKALNMDENAEIKLLLCLGYAGENDKIWDKKRKPTEEISKFI